MIKSLILFVFVAGGLGQQIAKKKCEEYAARAKAQPNAPQCQPLPTTYDISVDPKLFPANVMLGYKTSENDKPNFFCVAVIISEDFLIADAFCGSHQRSQDLKLARLGNATVYTSDVEITEIIHHPQFNNTTGNNKIGSIVLLKLKEKLGPSIIPACLNTQPLTEGEEALQVGMPVSGLNQRGRQPVTGRLRVEPLKKCEEAFKNNSVVVDERHLCVKDPSNGLGDCMSGPMYVARESCVHTVAGLAFYGPKPCGTSIPSLYDRIAHFVPWIESVAWPSD